MQMNNLEAWDIIREKYFDISSGVFAFNDPGQYVMHDSTFGGEHSILMRGDFSPEELIAIGWFLKYPEDFKYLLDTESDREALHVSEASPLSDYPYEEPTKA